MKKILFILLAITGCVFTSCENQEWEFPDFEYTTVYFAYQTPVRTITFGEDVWDTSLDNQGQCQIMATIGGVYSNDKDRTISFQIDNSIVDDITFADGSEIKAMPSSYYTLSDNNKIVIPKGKLLGGVTVQLTDAFFADPEATSGKYVIPVRMTDVQGADSILSGVPLVENPRLAVAGDWDVQPKNYVLYAVKYISQYDSWYLRAGTDNYADDPNYPVNRGTVNRQPASGYIEHAQQVKSFSTLDKNSILWDFEVADASGYARNAQLQLDFADNGAVTLTSLGTGNAATGSGSGQYTVLGEKNSWGGKDRDVMTLNYHLEWPEFIQVLEDGPLTHWGAQGSCTIDYVEVERCKQYYMQMSNETIQEQGWMAQVWAKTKSPMENGSSYTLTCKAKASADYTLGSFLQSSTDGSVQQFWPTPSLNLTTEWTEVSSKFSVSNDGLDKITFNIGQFAGTIEIDDVVLTKDGSTENLIANGKFDDYLVLRPAGEVDVTDKLVQWSRGVASEWFEVAAK